MSGTIVYSRLKIIILDFYFLRYLGIVNELKIILSFNFQTFSQNFNAILVNFLERQIAALQMQKNARTHLHILLTFYTSY